MTTISALAQGLSNHRWGQAWGTWVQQAHAGSGIKLPALVTIHIDGTITGAPEVMFGSIPNATVTHSPIYGVWERSGWKCIADTILILTFDHASGVLTGSMRIHSRVELATDFNSYAGTSSFESLPCPSPFACPDLLDPGAAWVPMPGMPASVPVSGMRFELVRRSSLTP